MKKIPKNIIKKYKNHTLFPFFYESIEIQILCYHIPVTIYIFMR